MSRLKGEGEEREAQHLHEEHGIEHERRHGADDEKSREDQEVAA
jgi:hypothetical protein